MTSSKLHNEVKAYGDLKHFETPYVVKVRSPRASTHGTHSMRSAQLSTAHCTAHSTTHTAQHTAQHTAHRFQGAFKLSRGSVRTHSNALRCTSERDLSRRHLSQLHNVHQLADAKECFIFDTPNFPPEGEDYPDNTRYRAMEFTIEQNATVPCPPASSAAVFLQTQRSCWLLLLAAVLGSGSDEKRIPLSF